MDNALQDLIRISNTVGKDVTLVQGGGGNTSVKTADGKYMYIKASGIALKDMDSKRGWRKMQLDAVKEILGDKTLSQLPTFKRETEVVHRLLLACCDDKGDDARPSVEAHLHAFLEDCVIHIHPDAVGAYVNAKDGRRHIEKLFAEMKIPPLWVPYADPGYCLARKIHQLVDDYQKSHGRKPQILFLEKHGLFISTATPQAGLRLVRQVIKKCSSKLVFIEGKAKSTIDSDQINACKLAIRKAVFETVGVYSDVCYFYDKAIAGFLANKNASRMLAAAALTPDEIVYANGPALWIDNPNSATIQQKLVREKDKRGKLPLAFVVKGVGLFVTATQNLAPVIADIVRTSLFVRVNASRMGGIASLTKRQQDFINNWESEAFRRKLIEGGAGQQLKSRIAVVTGAGSGLGRSIAVGLARAGTSVAIADIDIQAAEQTAEMIKNELPQSQVLLVHCNVTDEAAVADAFDQLVGLWGGLDILVNAAGIAPAFSLVNLPVDKWRLALEINLTGYFLMAKYAARIMIDQGIGGSIVNISSKSGLDASKNNTPYNATKAGELHMARGWAMELGEYGIRVNSVCPGNVFEGSKIWNPQYIRTCAKKYGIKPEEVIPYYVNKTTLRREIKGQDIADSVVFLCSDQSRTITGQTIVPDAGQVFVR